MYVNFSRSSVSNVIAGSSNKENKEQVMTKSSSSDSSTSTMIAKVKKERVSLVQRQTRFAANVQQNNVQHRWERKKANSLWTFLVPKAAIKITVKMARFSLFSCNFCYVWWFFGVLQHIWHSPFWKIIKYCKKFGEN